MEYKMVEKKDHSGKKVKVLDATFEPGIGESKGVGDVTDWRKKFASKDEMMTYLKSGERYWYSKEWFGSERRR